MLPLLSAIVFAKPNIDSTALANCWFKNPYDYMFNLRTEAPLSINNKKYAPFSAATDGLLYYGDAYQCVAELGSFSLRSPWSYPDKHGALELILKHWQAPELYDADPQHKSRAKECGMKAYNPKAIAWMRQWLPNQNSKIHGHSSQKVYTAIFSRFTRMMAESHLWFKGQEQPKLQKEYCNVVSSPQGEVDMLSYLEARYSEALPKYRIPANGTDFLPEYAIGFWIRRSIDGTETAFWENTLFILQRFDATWLAQLQSQNTNPNINWSVPAE